MKRFSTHTGRKRHQPGSMNSLERGYSDHLSKLKAAGEIIDFDFEAIKFRLAKATFYTPDFIVYPSEGPIEVHEVKGFWEDDARVKIKVAAEKFPFVFKAITRKKGEWKTELITPS